MTREESGKWEIGQDVAVVEKERRIPKGAPCIPDPSARVEKQRLVEDPQGAIAIGGLVTKGSGEGLGKMMCVEGQGPHARREETVDGKGQQGLVKDRNQRLGKDVGQRREARAETRGKNERSGSAHAAGFLSADSRSMRRRIASAAQAAPKPLSILVTVTPLAQLLTMPSRAASPSKLAP